MLHVSVTVLVKVPGVATLCLVDKAAAPKVKCKVLTKHRLSSTPITKLDIDLPVKGSFAQCPSSNLTHQSLSMWKLIAFSLHSAEVCKSH